MDYTPRPVLPDILETKWRERFESIKYHLHRNLDLDPAFSIHNLNVRTKDVWNLINIDYSTIFKYLKLKPRLIFLTSYYHNIYSVNVRYRLLVAPNSKHTDDSLYLIVCAVCCKLEYCECRPFNKGYEVWSSSLRNINLHYVIERPIYYRRNSSISLFTWNDTLKIICWEYLLIFNLSSKEESQTELYYKGTNFRHISLHNSWRICPPEYMYSIVIKVIDFFSTNLISPQPKI